MLQISASSCCQSDAMANPRRLTTSFSSSSSSDLPISVPPSPAVPPPSSVVSSFAAFLNRPSAFPFLLSAFVLLTWLFLRLEHPASAATGIRSSLSSTSAGTSSSLSQSDSRNGRDGDAEANLVRFSAVQFPSGIAKDRRGWLLNPVTAALEAGIRGGASECASVHVGEIQPGGLRGNHRHYTCNETFVIWGAETKFRLENTNMKEKGYAEVTINWDEVAIVASPSGTAHALINIDTARSTFFLGCQDNVIYYNSSTTDYNVWKDL